MIAYHVRMIEGIYHLTSHVLSFANKSKHSTYPLIGDVDYRIEFR